MYNYFCTVLKKLILIFVFSCVTISCFCQNDTIVLKQKKDTNISKIETTLKANKVDSSLLKNDSIVKNVNSDTTLFSLLKQFPLIKENAANSSIITSYKNFNNKTVLFYVLVFCFFLLAVIKRFYPKYFQSIFSIFFQTNFRQKQTKDQLIQDNVASLLTNIVFFLGVASLATLLVPKWNQNATLLIWQIFIGSLVAIICIYSVKFIFIHFLGWVFNIKEASNAYLFIVFIINKIIGIFLLPFCLIAAFSSNQLIIISEVIGIGIIIILLFYRMILTYKSTNSRLKINLLHFFLYFCSLEILPLLIVFKVLQKFL